MVWKMLDYSGNGKDWNVKWQTSKTEEDSHLGALVLTLFQCV